MDNKQTDWESRVDDVWKCVDAATIPLDTLVPTIDAFAAEQPADHPAALFERACARDTTGMEAEAEYFYRAALASDHLDAYRRSRASIQLGSTLRIRGQLEESERLLVAELDRHMEPGNPRALHDEARAILALTYLAQGRATEAAGLALCTLASHLSRYKRSVRGNGEPLVKATWS